MFEIIKMTVMQQEYISTFLDQLYAFQKYSIRPFQKFLYPQ